MKNLKTCTLTLLFLLTSTYAVLAQSVAIQETWSGSDSNITEPGCFLLTTESAWNEIWTKHSDLTEKPSVDFNTTSVLAVFEGQSLNSTGIFSIEAKEQPHDGQTLYIMSNSYQSMGIDGGGVKVTPFGIFVLPSGVKYKVIRGNPNGIGGPIIWQQLDCVIK